MHVYDMEDGVLLHLSGKLLVYQSSAIRTANAYRFVEDGTGVCLYRCGHFCQQPNLRMCCLCEVTERNMEASLCRLHAHLAKTGVVTIEKFRLRDHVKWDTVSWP